MSATGCPACAKAEATYWQRIAGALLDLIDRPSPAARMIASYGRAMSAALGVRSPSWYEKHRDEWVRTGDDLELARMLRHVGAGQ